MNRIKTGIKLQVTPEQSKQVQEICFANGIFWITSNNILQDYEFIYLKDKYLYRFTSSPLFKGSDLEEVDVSLFIRTNGSCIEENQEQELKQNMKEEQMKDNELETYKDVKEYLVAKGLYDRVMQIEWGVEDEYESFSALYIWMDTKEGASYWNKVDKELRDLDIHMNIESLVHDYKAKQGKEFTQYLETQPEEVVEVQPTQKPKQYLCYVQGKALPKHIHKTLEQAKQEAQRLCRKELAKVSVLEVVAEYEVEVVVKEVL